jgi:acyl-CoA thioester hydrolase
MDAAFAQADAAKRMNKENSRSQPMERSDFAWFLSITTRWMDNDVYGHLNNVVYYSFFDTAVNHFLVERGALDFVSGSSIGLVVHSQCNYFQPLAFPGSVDAGLRVSSIGTSSVHYQIGLFASGASSSAAWGRFVHVYVDRQTRRPQPLSLQLRHALVALKETDKTPDAP